MQAKIPVWLTMKRSFSDCFVISKHIQHHISNGKPVVALESTIITHGMPYPQNYETAKDVESIVEENGAIPATIAAVNGKIKIGISSEEMKLLADGSLNAHKISTRDLPMVITKCLSGGTTVSSTMLAAHHAGIKVFVTGGVGGVHRGVENSMDVSSDLTQLSRTPVAVVCAGIKSILDIGRSLEYMETLGVCVATISNSGDFPAFFTTKSGFKSPHFLANEIEAARIIDSNEQLGTDTGLLIAVAIPDEFSQEGEIIETAIQKALQESREKGLTGKDVTPYILQRVAQLTENKSLYANIALIKNNAKIGSRIAVELTKLQTQPTNHEPFYRNRPMKSDDQNNGSKHQPMKTDDKNNGTKDQPIKSDVTKLEPVNRPIVVGGLIIDHNVKLNDNNLQTDGATYPGQMRQIFGGVARNMADVLARLKTDPLLISAVGDDIYKGLLLSQCDHMDLSGLLTFPGYRTANCCLLISSDGHSMYNVSDLDIFKQITPEHIAAHEHAISTAPFVCVDANLSTDVVSSLLEICTRYNIPVLYEPTDRTVAGNIFQQMTSSSISIASPNVIELLAMYAAFSNTDVSQIDDKDQDIITACVSMCDVLTNQIPLIVTTLGHQGVLVCHKLQNPDELLTHNDRRKNDKMAAVYYPECNSEEAIVSTLGAGDCMVSAFMWGLLQGRGLDLSVRSGMLAARLALQTHQTVDGNISPQTLSEENVKSQMPSNYKVVLDKDYREKSRGN